MKYYLNAMPKSGLHLLSALVKPLTMNAKPLWAGNRANNSFTMQGKGPEFVTNAICYLPDNWRLIGHCAYDEDVEWYLTLSGVAHIFITRDLRDVAVSQAHHILSDDDNLKHPDKELYRALGGFDDVLRAVWYGIDGYPGVFDRWREYAPWLDRADVLVLRFEEVIADLEAAADTILDYVHGLSPAYPQLPGKVPMKMTGVMNVTNATAMVESALDTGASPTFRKGKAGSWRQYMEIIPEWQESRFLV